MTRGRARVRAIWLRRRAGCCLARIFKDRVITLAFLFAATGLVVSPSSVTSYQYRVGTVEGTVTDFAGSPVPNATVYVLQNGRAPAGITDANGNFVLTNIAVGPQRIFAYKESDDYPNPVWSFYGDTKSQEGFPLVSVREDRPLRNVIVRLGPKSSRLHVAIIDAITKRPVSGATLSLNHEGKPKTLYTPGAASRSGELAVLIPAGIPVNLKVTAAGYHTWVYRDKTSTPPNAIQLKVGEKRSIKIELTKTYGARAK
jgi:hypothetical protein